jgi:hypothetical protein
VTTARGGAFAGLVIGGSLLLAACGRATGTAQPATPPTVHHVASLIVTHLLPPLDLEAAGLTRVADLVTPFQLTSTDNGRRITLIAAYADAARMALLFREDPDMGVPNVSVNDEQGLINSGSSAGPVRTPGVRGDYYVALDAGPHAGADGLAHLTIRISGLSRWTPAGGAVNGSWAFDAALKVQSGQALAAPNQFRLGAWTVTVETLELTPAVVHLQTLVNGASPVAIVGPGKGAFVELVDVAGNPVTVLADGAGITVPKGQLNPSNYQNSRTRDEWLRPAAGTYRLRFQGGGSRYEIPIVIAT